MTEEFRMQDAIRRAQNLFMGFAGPSGGGKTFSALRVARGLQRVYGGDICVIDADNHRSELHADTFKFKVIHLSKPFGAERYQRATEAAVKQGARHIIIDTMSHEHEGVGGVLERHAQETDRLAKAWRTTHEKASMSAWNFAKGPRKAFAEYIRTELNANMLMCFRAAEKTKPDREQGIVDLGWMPIAGVEYTYEMHAFALLPPNSEGVPEWNPEGIGAKRVRKWPDYFKSILVPGKQLNEAMGEAMGKHLQGAAPTERELESADKLKPWLERINATKSADELAALYDELAAAAKSGTLSKAETGALRRAYDARAESFDNEGSTT